MTAHLAHSLAKVARS